VINLKVVNTLICLSVLAASAELFAAPAASPAVIESPHGDGGTITGRIFSPATGEYLRNAQIRIEETGQSVVSESGGEFRIERVTPGVQTLVVTYTGYQSAKVTVVVIPDTTVARNIDLISSLQGDAASGGPVQLEAFIVASQREGSAKAIMDQRNSMNITNIVASDLFGDDAEGNLGEFLKHLPGVEADTAFGEVRTIGLRGLGSEYTSVTIDGMALSTADPTLQGAVNSRAFTFETVSLSSMDSIEISKTVSADMEANAPAGRINLRTKRAFDLPGRRISWQANVAAHSEELHLNRTMGPDERHRRKLRPGGMLEYSDVFLNRRLGIVFNVSESNLYQEASTVTLTFNRVPTAADPRPEVLTQLTLGSAQRLNERFSSTFTADFKATEQLVLSLGVIYNWSELWQYGRNAIFGAGARNTVIGTDPLVRFTTNSTAALAAGRASGIAKLGQTFTVLPKFEYKWRNLTVEGKFAFSRSNAWYDPMNRQTSALDVGGSATRGVTFVAERASANAYDWTITQTAGPNFANGYTDMVAIGINDFRSSRRNTYGGEISATLTANFVVPVVWKAGVKTQYELYTFANLLQANQYTYAPNGTNVGWNSFKSPYPYELGMTNTNVTSLSGGTIFMPDMLAIGRRFNDHPSEFTHSLTPANYTTAFITSPRRYEETIDATYFMGTARLGKAAVRAGFRWEQTSGDATELDQRSAQEVRDAGFPVGANGRATTIPGLEYQFFSKPWMHRIAKYDDLFPSASLKYSFTRNLDFQFGYSRTIRRPAFKDVAGFFNVNDQTRVIAAPNINLQPEYSDNLSARLAHYFEPVGIVAFNLFQNNVDGLMITNTLTAEEFGYTGPEDFSGYEFTTTANSGGMIRIRGMELEYSQSLSFLPGLLQGLGVRASYTHNSADSVVPDLARNSASAGINYSHRRFSASVNALWKDNVTANIEETAYRRHRTTLDANAGYRLTTRTSLFISARNLTNSKLITMDKFDPHPAVWRSYQVTGITFTLGVKGRF